MAIIGLGDPFCDGTSKNPYIFSKFNDFFNFGSLILNEKCK